MLFAGVTTRLVAKYRPRVPILSLTGEVRIANQMQGVLKNVTSVIVNGYNTISNENLIKKAIQVAKEKGLCKTGDSVVCVHGVEQTQGSTNTLRVVVV